MYYKIFATTFYFGVGETGENPLRSRSDTLDFKYVKRLMVRIFIKPKYKLKDVLTAVSSGNSDQYLGSNRTFTNFEFK